MTPDAFLFTIRVHKRRLGLAVVAASMVLAIGVVWRPSSDEADDQTRADLVAEFGDSYGITARADGSIAEVDLVAGTGDD